MWIISATRLSVHKANCSNQIMGGVKPLSPCLEAICTVLLWFWATLFDFYVTPQKFIKKLASKVAATAKSTASLVEFIAGTAPLFQKCWNMKWNISKMSHMHRLQRPAVRPHVHKLTHNWAIWGVSLVSFVFLWTNYTQAKALTFILLRLYVIKLRQEFGFLAHGYINALSVKDAVYPNLTCLHI